MVGDLQPGDGISVQNAQLYLFDASKSAQRACQLPQAQKLDQRFINDLFESQQRYNVLASNFKRLGQALLNKEDPKDWRIMVPHRPGNNANVCSRGNQRRPGRLAVRRLLWKWTSGHA